MYLSIFDSPFSGPGEAAHLRLAGSGEDGPGLPDRGPEGSAPGMIEGKWRRALDRWELVDAGGIVIGSISYDALLDAPVEVDAWRAGNGWPPIPDKEPEPGPVWEPWSVHEILLVLDGGPEGLAEAKASFHSRTWGYATG